MKLSEFLDGYQSDDNEWWRLEQGEAQNIFDGAVEGIAVLGARAERAVAYAARRKRSPDYEPPTAGRPATLDDGQAVTVYLPAAMAERAAELGDGNVSAGVRIALQRALS